VKSSPYNFPAAKSAKGCCNSERAPFGSVFSAQEHRLCIDQNWKPAILPANDLRFGHNSKRFPNRLPANGLGHTYAKAGNAIQSGSYTAGLCKMAALGIIQSNFSDLSFGAIRCSCNNINLLRSQIHHDLEYCSLSHSRYPTIYPSIYSYYPLRWFYLG
jgi:hypothetical protein